MGIDKLVRSPQIYEISLPISKKSKEITLKASSKEGKESKINNENILTFDDLILITKKFKNTMKVQKKNFQELNSKNGKWFILSLRKKKKALSRSKKIEIFNNGGLKRMALDYPNPKKIKKAMQVTWSDFEIK